MNWTLIKKKKKKICVDEQILRNNSLFLYTRYVKFFSSRRSVT